MSINIDVTDPYVDQTTNATPKTLATMSMDSHSIQKIRVLLMAFCTDDSFKTWELSGWARRASNGTITLYGDLLSVIPSATSNILIGWTLDVDVSGGDVNFIFTGQSGKTIDLLFLIDLGAKFTP